MSYFKFSSFTTMAKKLVVVCLFFSATYASLASTGDSEGVIKQIISSGGVPIDLVFLVKRTGYISAYSAQNDTFYISQSLVTLGSSRMPSNITVCMLDGVIVNSNVILKSLAVGKRLYIHNNRQRTQMCFLDNTKEVINGKIESVDFTNNNIIVREIIKNGLGGLGHHAGPVDTLLTISFNPTDVFKYEGQVLPASQVLQVGRHVRYYQARNQTILSYTPSALVSDRTFITSGVDTFFSWVTQGFFRGYDFTNKIVYFAEYRKGKWIDNYRLIGSRDVGYQSTMVDGHYMNEKNAAARIGDRITIIPYAQPGDGLQSKVEVFRAQDDESIEGYIKAVSGNQVTIRILKCPTGLAQDVVEMDTVITLQTNAKYLLNGLDSTQSSALQVGNYVRILNSFSGAFLTRNIDNNFTQMHVINMPTNNLPPLFVSDTHAELIYYNRFWKQKDTITATEGDSVLFETFLHSFNTANVNWYRNNFVLIPGANLTRYLRKVTLSDDNTIFRAIAQNLYGADTSLPILLKIRPDTSSLRISKVKILDSTSILITFNKPVTRTGPNGAENIANYSINKGINITYAFLLGNELNSVLLKTSPLIFGNEYELTINNIQDLAQTPNQIAPNTKFTINYEIDLKYFKMYFKGNAGSLSSRAGEVRYIQNGIQYGQAKTYFGNSNSSNAFDGNNTTYVQAPSSTSPIGLDMGLTKIKPDTISVTMTPSTGRNALGLVVEVSNDLNGPWFTLLNINDTLKNGQVYSYRLNYSQVTPSTVFVGSKIPQLITFPAIPDQLVDSSYVLNATSSSELPVTYQVLEGNAFIQDGAVVCNDTGIVVIRAMQNGNSVFFPAYPETISFRVLPNPSVITAVHPLQQATENQVIIYPNPVEDVFVIEGNDLPGSWLQVTDIEGKVWYKTQIEKTQVEINAQPLPRGIYIIHIKGNVNVVRKLMVK